MAQVDSIGNDGQRALQNAVVRLLKNRPFYGHFLMHFRRQFRSGAHAVGVTFRNGTPVLNVDANLFARLNHDEQQAMLEHGLKHILHLHPSRQKHHHRQSWDVATDLAINPSIEHLPDSALLPARFNLDEGHAAEEYARLLTPFFETGHLEGEGVGRADEAGQGTDHSARAAQESIRNQAATLDDHSVWADASSTPERLAEQVVRDMVAESFRKSGGDVPDDVRDAVDDFLRPPTIPWREVLRQFVATAGRVGHKTTWKREHRRFAHETPGLRKRKRLNLLVGIDTSESTDILELREAFARELLSIAKARDCLVTVLYANSRIKRIATFSGQNVIADVYRGGGFTDLRPVFEYARSMQPLPAAVIYLTDGYGPAPETMDFPTLWVLTSAGKKPVDWGVELRLDV